jgi:hypothetical protein
MSTDRAPGAQQPRYLHAKKKPANAGFSVAGAGFEQTSATAYRFVERRLA